MIIVVVVGWLIFSCEYLHALLNLKGYLVHLEKRYYKVNCYVLGLFLSLYDDIWYVTYLIDSRCLFDLKCLSQMDGGGELTDVLIGIELKLISCYTKQFFER